MKKLLCITALILPQFLFSNSEEQLPLSLPPKQSTYVYFMTSATSAYYPVLGLGLGFRHQIANWAVDASINVPFIAPINWDYWIDFIYLSDIKVMGLYYPKQKGLYLGAGVGVVPLIFSKGLYGPIPGKSLLILLPRLAIGYEWESKKHQFVQLSVIAPIVLAYGRSF